MATADRSTKQTPLTPTVFEILLSLNEKQLHGYAIMSTVKERTGGRLELLPGSLYRALSRLEASEWIEVSELRPEEVLDDARRRYYQLTALGRSALQAEAHRLQDLVNAAIKSNLLEKPGGTR